MTYDHNYIIYIYQLVSNKQAALLQLVTYVDKYRILCIYVHIFFFFIVHPISVQLCISVWLFLLIFYFLLHFLNNFFL